MKMFKIIRKFYFVLLFLAMIIGCDSEDDNKEDTEMPCTFVDGVINDTNILTWDEIYEDSITKIVGNIIVIKSKLYWHTDFGWFDTKPEINPASDIRLLFENADNYIENENSHEEERGNLLLNSNHIEKYICYSEKQETYALNCKELSNNNKFYLIQGRIEFRDNPTEEQLSNPEFIEQCNNIVYWSQTFEFVEELIFEQ